MVPLKLINMIFTWKNIITQVILTQLLPFAVVFFTNTSSVDFTFTSHTDVYELIMSTIVIFSANILVIAENNSRCTTNREMLKLAQQLFQRVIITFVLLYVLTVFSNNLSLAILGLSNTIVFTFYGVWCTIVFTYLFLFSFMIFAIMYDLIKSRIYPVETTMFLKVLSGYAGNSFIMSPLTKKVGNEMRPEWGFMMQNMMLVMLTIGMVMIMVIVMFLKDKRHTI